MSRGKGKSKGRKRRRGMLGGFKYGDSKSTKKKTLPRKIGEWVVGGLAVTAMGFILVLLLWRMFSPDYGVEHAEAAFEPTRIEVHDEPLAAEEEGGPARVAKATIEIKGYEVGLQLTAEQLEAVRGGAAIHAEYTFEPFNRGARVIVEPEGWYVEGVDEPPRDPSSH